MNYISHYYFDQSTNDVSYLLGTIFPDLMSEYDRSLRAKARKLLKNDFSDELAPFRQGIRRHYHLDAVFHNSFYFREKTTYLYQQLEQLALNSMPLRKPFFAHVLVELLLDRILLDDDFSLVETFYANLSTPLPNSLINYLNVIPVNKKGEAFLGFYQRFLDKSFLKNYIQNDFIINVLSNISYKITKNSFTIKDKTLLNFHLEKWKLEIKPNNFPSILV